MIKRLTIILVLLGMWIQGYSQEGDDSVRSLPRPVTSLYEMRIGGSDLLNTYISPLKYSGIHLALAGAWSKALPANPERLSMRFTAVFSGDRGTHPFFSTSMLSADLNASWGMRYKFSLSPQWNLTVGGSLGFDIGGFYLPNNGNNPATANFRLGISPEASVSYATHLGKLRVKFIEEISIPTAGVAFSPEYGESYYEIWIGNHSGLSQFAWWGNCFCLSNFIGGEMKFSRGSLRIGYHFNVNSSYLNHINTQKVTHSIGIGYIPAYRKSCNNNPPACYAEY